MNGPAGNTSSTKLLSGTGWGGRSEVVVASGRGPVGSDVVAGSSTSGVVSGTGGVVVTMVVSEPAA